MAKQEFTKTLRQTMTAGFLKVLIEKLANEQGEKARVLYDYERAEIQKEFPHIPKELL